jgi:tetratricopeptide (TPR) repeat protein
VHMPPTVQAVVAARIDRLRPEDKRLLQAASVIGEDVPLPLLQAITDVPDDELRAALARLEAAGFLTEIGLFPDLQLSFRHSLTHDVAYETLLQERRRQLHHQVMLALERLHAGESEPPVERLAHHARRGEVWDKAVGYCRQAGLKALARLPGREPVTYLEQALEALRHLPDADATLDTAVDIRLDLRNALMPLGDHPGIYAHLRDAEALAERRGDRRRLARVLSVLGTHFWNVGESDRSVEAGQRAVALAEEIGDLDLQIAGDITLGGAYRSLGQYRRAIEFFRRNVAWLSGDLERQTFGLAGLPAVVSRSHLGWCLAELGEFPEALRLAREGVRLAEAAAHAYSLSHAYLGLGGVLIRQGHFDEAQPVLERGLAACASVPLLFPPIATDLGVAYARTGRVIEGVGLVERGIERASSMGKMGRLALLESHLCDIYFLAGRLADAAAVGARALELATEQKERGNEVYVHRLLGKIAVAQDPPDVGTAEDHLGRALALAEELEMRPLVARCHLVLGWLAHRLGDQARMESHLARAVPLFRAMDMRYWLALIESART